MSEIKTSQKGVDYANPCTLKSKQRVYSQAMLMKILHDHPDKTDISLKIGRYNYLFGRAVNDKPKSELTLDNDELNALIKYISENYTPVNLGSGEYINVDGSNAALISEFKKLVEGQADTANLLIENGILPCQSGASSESCFATSSRRGSGGSFQSSASVRSSSHISFSGLRFR